MTTLRQSIERVLVAVHCLHDKPDDQIMFDELAVTMGQLQRDWETFQTDRIDQTTAKQFKCKPTRSHPRIGL